MYNDIANIILPNGKKLKHTDSDAYPFFWLDFEFYIGEAMETHIELMQSIIKNNIGKYLKTASDMVGNDTYDDGRIWLKKKTIGLYKHITDNLFFNDMIDELEQHFNIKIDSDWMIVVQEFYGTIDEYKKIHIKKKINTVTPKRTHVKSPMDASRIKTKPYNKNKSIELRFAMGENNIQKFNDYSYISESAGVYELEVDGNLINFDEALTYPFFYDEDNKVYIGSLKGNYSDLRTKYKPIGEKFTGRLWQEYKTIAIDDSLTYEEMLNVVNDLSNLLNINITDDWCVELFIKGISEVDVVYTTIDKMRRNERGRKLKLSREEYDKRLAAHLDASNKSKKFGSPLIAWDSNRPLPYRQKIYQENMNIQKFDSFINENKQQETKINNIIDITVIKPDAQKEDILSAIDLAREKKYYGVVVQPEFVDFLSYELSDEENIKVVSVLDFPDGEMRLDKKISEAIDLISNGAEEIDMAINIKEFKENHKKENDDKEAEYVKLINELKPIADECHKNGVILKLIIETGMLSMEELIDMSNIIQKSGIDYIQTSTGMNGEGSELSKIKELRRLLPDYVKIKAAGGIRTISDANKLYPYVDRIGTSVALK